MRKSIWVRILTCMLLLVLMTTVVSAASLEEKKQEVRQKTADTLKRLYEKQPSVEKAIANAAGYAVFFNTGYKLGIFGSSHGRGMAVNNTTGEEAFMRMKEFQAGLGLGVKEYSVIFVFGNDEVWEDFVNAGWEFGGNATASADDGVNGDSLQGSLVVAPGIWMYQMTTKGLALELAVRGTNYYRDHDFDDPADGGKK